MKKGKLFGLLFGMLGICIGIGITNQSVNKVSAYGTNIPAAFKAGVWTRNSANFLIADDSTVPSTNFYHWPAGTDDYRAMTDNGSLTLDGLSFTMVMYTPTWTTSTYNMRFGFYFSPEWNQKYNSSYISPVFAFNTYEPSNSVNAPAFNVVNQSVHCEYTSAFYQSSSLSGNYGFDTSTTGHFAKLTGGTAGSSYVGLSFSFKLVSGTTYAVRIANVGGTYSCRDGTYINQYTYY